MMRYGMFLIFGILCACAPVATNSFRDTDQPIGVTTRFDPEAFSGSWVLVESFADHARAPVIFTFTQDTNSITIRSDEATEIAGKYSLGQPGHFVSKTPAQENLLIMWVDEGFRTAAIGTASGSFGAVLNRDANLPPDRARAAREVLSFYGWNTNLLERTVQ